MALINFSKLTPRSVMKLQEIIVREVFLGGVVSDFFNVVPAKAGDRIPLWTPKGFIGKPGTGCNPENDELTTVLDEKEWNPKKWGFRIPICYEDYEDTLYEMGLKPNTEITELEGTKILDFLLDRLIEPKLQEMLLRFGFFGDTEAANIVTNEGVTTGSITAGIDPKYFKVVNGAWKQIYGYVADAASGIKKFDIAANREATSAAQFEADVKPLEILNKIVNHAPLALRQTNKESRVLIVTDCFMQKLRELLMNESIHVDAQFETRRDGIETVKLYGQTITSLPYLDVELQRSFNSGTKIDNPFRILYTVKENLKIGLPDGEALSDFKTFYDNVGAKNYIEGRGKLDVKVVRPELIAVAY